ncbi:MAG: hypothetical protein L3J79_04790, partial [Candidatus Marinimicrobia bacterium]|nr:hypothetical protein [Candidatus Neomarinimicrobiota bacterium]
MNSIRDFIWDVNDADGQSNGILYEYIDSTGLVSFTDINDLVPTSGNLPPLPPLVDDQLPLPQVQADAQAVVASILNTLEARDVLLGDNFGVSNFHSAAVVSTGQTEIYGCVDENTSEFVWWDESVCFKFDHALANAGTTSFGGGASSISSSSTGSPGSGGCGVPNILISDVTTRKAWSSGFVKVDSSNGFEGQFLVYVRLYNPSGGINLAGPVPGDGAFHLVGALGSSGGQIGLTTPEPPDPICVNDVISGYNGWGIRTGTPGTSNSDIVVLAIPNTGYIGSDLGGCDPDMAGFADAILPVVGEEDDGSIMAPGCGDSADANPESEFPISYATGHKYESVVDLRVSVTGPDWVLRRDYSSDPNSHNLLNGNLVGDGWSQDAFCHLLFDAAGADTITLVGFPQKSKTVFVRTPETSGFPADSAFTRWHTGGPTSQVLKRAVVFPDDSFDRNIPVWILEEPGKWQMVFHRNRSTHPMQYDQTTGTVNQPAALHGKMALWYDAYGNYRYYQYWLGNGVARLRNIYLNGTPNRNFSDAIIQFDWYSLSADPLIAGMLDKVSVLRPTDVQDEYLTTQYVDYVYGAETNGVVYIGEDTDLVAVEQAVIMDETDGVATTPYYSRFTQYRYHDGGLGGGDSDERLNVSGAKHQLKMIIEPEQVEYIAQKRVVSGEQVSTSEQAVKEVSDWLMLQPDNGSLGTWSTEGFQVIDAASKIVGYENDGLVDRVITEFIQTACGCGGGATQGQKIEFNYDYSYTWASGNDGRSVEEKNYKWNDGASSWDLHRTKYVDLEYLAGSPYTRYEVIEEPGGLRQWITEFEYDSKNNLEIESTPSWFSDSSYTPIFTSSVPPAIIGTQTNGLRQKFAYTDDNRLAEAWVWDSSSSSSGFVPTRQVLYELASQPWLVTKDRRFTNTGVSLSPPEESVETIEYTYDFYNSGDYVYGTEFSSSFVFYHNTAIAAIGQHVEAELGDENGPSSVGQYSVYTVFDGSGQPVWSAREDNSLVYREFDQLTGLEVLVVENADPVLPNGGLGVGFNPSNFGNLSSLGSIFDSWGYEDNGSVRLAGGEIVKGIKFDPVGRVVSMTSPGGVTHSTIRSLFDASSRPGVLYPATVALPHDLGVGTMPTRFDGPVVIQWMNAGGSIIEQASHTLDESASFDPLSEAGAVYTLETDSSGFDQGQLSRTVVDHTLSGLVEAEHVWHDVYRDASYSASYEYDSLGRLAVTLDPVGTARYFGSDVLDRVHEQRIDSILSPGPIGFDFASAL